MTIPTLVLARQLGNGVLSGQKVLPAKDLRAEPMSWSSSLYTLSSHPHTVRESRPGEGIVAQLNSRAVEKPNVQEGCPGACFGRAS